MIGVVTLLTIAAETESRYSFGCRGAAALHESRQSETMASTRFRISEVYAVADADEQARGVADLQSRRILAQLGATFELQDVAMALIVQVAVRRVEDLRKTGISGFALKQHTGSDTPGPEQRVPRDELPANDVVGRRLVVTDHRLVEIVCTQDAGSQQLHLVRNLVAPGARERFDASRGGRSRELRIEHIENGLETLSQLLERRGAVR